MQHTQQTQEQTLPKIIIDLFKKRGLTDKQIEEFLSWDLHSLPDMSQMKDVKKAAEIIVEHLDEKKKIAIYGDYDVDGTTSCALFYQFFKMINVEVDLVQPSRFVEGYGLHLSSINDAIDRCIDLMITVDCGITNNEAATYAKEKGLGLIITDHHKDARDEMPEALAIVNPNRRDETHEEMRSLAGVGVAFAVCVEIRKILMGRGENVSSLYPLLEYVAIGTICDLAKLTPMNLKLVRHGLKSIKSTKFEGIKTFFDPEERSKDIIPSEKLSFNVGPLINSKGRLDHPEIALNLLIETDNKKARELYHHLQNCNEERKAIQKEVFDEAYTQVLEEMKVSEPNIAIVYAPHWHEGVIGIVASKLVETFKIPAVVFSDAEEEGVIKASARSAGELNIFNLLNDNSDLFLKFGGHKAAAGLSMQKENLEVFKNNMNQALLEIPLIERTVTDFYDLEIEPEEITPTLLKSLDMLEPFGMGNAKPIFKLKNAKLKSFDLLKDVHVRWNFCSKKNENLNLKGISFNYIGKYGLPSPMEVFERQKSDDVDLEVFFTLGFNYFRGNKYIQLMVNKVTIY